MQLAKPTLSAYVHVPYCRVRCGYCDFNTYTATELRGVTQHDFVTHVGLEIESAKAQLTGDNDTRPLSTVFFGGGTPTLLPAPDLISVLHALHENFGLEPNAEVTVEANPDSVTPEYFDLLRTGGVTRVSFGVQSAVPSVLKTLDRTHNPDRVPEVVSAARDAGLAVSVDLIYGTPGESLRDWTASLDLVQQLSVEHVSAYSLIVEEGTALARKIRAGELPSPDLDLQADMYMLADERFHAMGLEWYELSNWSRTEATQSRHNQAYWRNEDWWGFGAGAHSHVAGKRWWNVKHPAAYAQRLLAGESPEHGHELTTAQEQYVESVLLGTRLRAGLPIAALSALARKQVPALIAEGLIDGPSALRGTLVLTLAGRLVADAVVRRLTD